MVWIRGISHNIGVLGIDVAEMSNGFKPRHFDHWGGLVGLLRQYMYVLPKDCPFGHEAFAYRFSIRPSGSTPMDGREKSEVEQFGGFDIKELKNPGAPSNWLPQAREEVLITKKEQ